jgi:hypothetical protein
MTTSEAEAGPSLPFIIVASSCGTLIEWYDFYLYSVLAGFFASHFFPGSMTQGFLFGPRRFRSGLVAWPVGTPMFGYRQAGSFAPCRG